MRRPVTGGPTPTRDIVLAVQLLLGILALGYGFFAGRSIFLYGGLALIIAGVLRGIVNITTRGSRSHLIVLAAMLALAGAAPPCAGGDDAASQMAARPARIAEGEAIAIGLDPMPARYQDPGTGILDLFAASPDSVFWCGPIKPNPHSWLSPAIICRDRCDFEVILFSAEDAVVDTLRFAEVEPAFYRIRFDERRRPAPGIYTIRYVYGDEVVDERRIDIPDPR